MQGWIEIEIVSDEEEPSIKGTVSIRAKDIKAIFSSFKPGALTYINPSFGNTLLSPESKETILEKILHATKMQFNEENRYEKVDNS